MAAVPHRNVLSGPYVDRIAHLRRDAAFLAAALRDPETLIVPVWRSRCLVRREELGGRAFFVEAAHELRSGLADDELVLLGRFRGRVCFAAELDGDPAPEVSPTARFEDLRAAVGLLPEDEAGLLAYARALLFWRQRHRYCGACGAPTRSSSAGHVMKCTAEGCDIEHFPRLDPAIIVLVTDGERALLGRQAAWPPGRYSTIAGFVEPGESLEDAVAREVQEETGVAVTEASYHSSQPWPFPSSLMIGFTARATADAAPRADDELEDARWFTREEIASGTPLLPPPQSVSFRLIEDWFDSGAEVPLRQCPGVDLWGAPSRPSPSA
jgi:NAD+ diphosphatase